MDTLPKYEIPWDVITASLQNNLSAEEAVQLQQWLSSSTANQEKYDQLSRIWNEGLNDFAVYQSANETKAWEAFQQRSATLPNEEKQSPVIKLQFTGRLSGMRKWMAVAAVFILTIGVIYWYSESGNKELMYATAANEQKNITLPDGSTILLKQQSQIEVAGTYNKQNRTVTLVNGEAFFTVIHQPRMTFIVNMGSSSVRDIGTSFTIQKTENTIKVTVASGKVAFIRNETNESRELSEGMALSYNIPDGRFVEVPSQAIPATGNTPLLLFDNIPLSDVINIVQQAYGKKIELNNGTIGQKRFKADLRGQSFEKALQVICISLSLDYTEKNGAYLLKEKENK